MVGESTVLRAERQARHADPLRVDRAGEELRRRARGRELVDQERHVGRLVHHILQVRPGRSEEERRARERERRRRHHVAVGRQCDARVGLARPDVAEPGAVDDERKARARCERRILDRGRVAVRGGGRVPHLRRQRARRQRRLSCPGRRAARAVDEDEAAMADAELAGREQVAKGNARGPTYWRQDDEERSRRMTRDMP